MLAVLEVVLRRRPAGSAADMGFYTDVAPLHRCSPNAEHSGIEQKYTVLSTEYTPAGAPNVAARPRLTWPLAGARPRGGEVRARWSSRGE